MEFTRYTLRNGIRCIHKQVRSAAVHCALTVGTGSRDEQPAEHGMAHLLEHAFFKGTERRRAYHINCRLENLGGELNAYTTKEETVIHTTTLRADLSKAAELIADIVLQLLSYVAETERAFIRQRQAEGIAAARARGQTFGRPRLEVPPAFAEVHSRWSCGELSSRAAAEQLGISQPTFLRWVRETP